MRRELKYIELQIKEIINGGSSVLLRKLCQLFEKLYTLFLIPFAILIVFIIRLLRPLVVIRIGEFESSRIGHLAMINELHLCKRDAGIYDKKTYDIYYCKQPISNYQLKKMFERVMNISRLSCLLSLVCALNDKFAGFEMHQILDTGDRDKWGFKLYTKPHLFFTPKEEKKGQNEIRRFGLDKDALFVCFHARDSVYLDATYPTLRDWRYHDYRDCDITTFIPAIEYLTKQRYYAFRMGAVVKKPIVCNNPMIIDYATKYRSDFMDIYLSAKCSFFIGTSCGIDEVPKIFRKPVIYVNLIPIDKIEALNTVRLFIPKRLWLRRENRFLTFREILYSKIIKNHYLADEYVKNDIEIINNTPEEIFELIKEMDEWLKGVWQTTQEDEEMQQHYWSLYDKTIMKCKISVRIGKKFLRQNRELLK